MTTKEMSDFLNSLWCWARCTEEEQHKLSEIADYLSNWGNEKNDCISRKRAIERLKLNLPISDGADNSKDRYRYMQSLADIQAIRELPSVTPQEPQSFKWCETCKEYDQEKHCCHRYSKVIRDTVEEMKQEPKTGHWIEDAEQHHVEKTYHCSECGHGVWGEYEKTEYCGGCGARMVEPQESEDKE